MDSLIEKWQSSKSEKFLETLCIGGGKLTANEESVLVLDSSFNPPTLAHAKLLSDSLTRSVLHEGQRANLSFDRVLCLLSVDNADKGHISPETARHRLQMMKLVLDALPNNLCPLEIGLTNCSRFVEKAEMLSKRRQYPFFIVGYDTLIRIFNPKYYSGSWDFMNRALEHLFSLASIICQERAEGENETLSDSSAFLRDLLESGKVKNFGSKIYTLPPSPDLARISSTKVREQGCEEALLPSVRGYIQKNALYKGMTADKF